MARKTNEKQPKKSAKKSAGKKTKPSKVSYHKKPETLELRDWQIELRRQFGQTQAFTIENAGTHPVYSEFKVHNPDVKSAYKVAIRSNKPGLNFCSCPDFKSNTLGTCKHVEAVLFKIHKTRGLRKYFKQPYDPEYTSVYLHYGETREVKIRIGSGQRLKMQKVAAQYFDKDLIMSESGFANFEKFSENARRLDPGFRCYPDALEYILQHRENLRRKAIVENLNLAKNTPYVKTLIKANLFPYQLQGLEFAAKAGRCLLADEMGLGKTIQAIATAELWKREMGVSKVLIVCPTSLKYQWKSEIEKFTDSAVTVIEGMQTKRRRAYRETESFYQIVTYNVVSNDADYLNEADYDAVILDEAQRIKNWNTKISRAVKRLQTNYALVLTGTPLENKLEELYSIVQFVDNYQLGPLYLFQHRYQVKDEFGRIVGYRDLGNIKKLLSDLMLRRTKKQVLTQLPKRMDKNLFVPMTEMQSDIHRQNGDEVAKLVAKWRRWGFLNEKDRQLLMILLNQMRMVCDSTYILDQASRHDTKVDELMCILEEALTDEETKVVVFSQWERMTRLVAKELEERGIGFEYLHGGVPSSERGKLLENFAGNSDSKIFLSTDAGGVGLNLQSASLLVNLDIPWNPAVLEQRIGRIYRMGQKRPVNIINLVATGTIEHKMLYTLNFKSQMAAGVLDDGEDAIFMSSERFKEFMENVERLTEGVPEVQAPEEVTSDSDMEQIEVGEAGSSTSGETTTGEPEREEAADRPQRQPKPAAQSSGSASGNGAGNSPPQAAELVQMGANFFSALTRTLSDENATRQLVDSLVEKDKTTGQTYLKIPVESQDMVKGALQLLGGLLKGLG